MSDDTRFETIDELNSLSTLEVSHRLTACRGLNGGPLDRGNLAWDLKIGAAQVSRAMTDLANREIARSTGKGPEMQWKLLLK